VFVQLQQRVCPTRLLLLLLIADATANVFAQG
jgi:hypothetical protein